MPPTMGTNPTTVAITASMISAIARLPRSALAGVGATGGGPPGAS